jgi:hypothetical protein
VPDDAIAWAQGILKQHPDRAAIVATHAYLKGRQGVAHNPKHNMRHGGNSGEGYKQHSNDCHNDQQLNQGKATGSLRRGGLLIRRKGVWSRNGHLSV